MRRIQLVVGDKEFDGLEKLKGDLSWEDFVLSSILKTIPKKRKAGRKKDGRKNRRKKD